MRADNGVETSSTSGCLPWHRPAADWERYCSLSIMRRHWVAAAGDADSASGLPALWVRFGL